MLYRHLYTENKEQFNLKAVLRHSPTESCYLYTNTYIQKDTCIKPRWQGAAMEVLPGMGFTSFNIKSFHPRSLLCTT